MKEIKILWKCLLILGVVSLFTACGDDDEAAPEPQNLVEIAAADGQFSILVSALQRTGLDQTLAGTGPFTVFAPTNAAFDGIDVANMDVTMLTNILRYHVFIGQALKAGDIADGDTYITTASEAGFNGTNMSARINKANGAVTINGDIRVTTADVEGTNGVIHIIDKVMMPLDVVGHALANPNFSSLVGALGDAAGDLVNTLQQPGPYTVFAPVNSAFDEVASVVAGYTPERLRDVLLYHVVSGNVRSSDLRSNEPVTTVNTGTFTVQLGDEVTIIDAQERTATVVLTDVQGTNGVIHVINKVILP
ncbi:MAG: fasciclin domain-containing protein [Bacteroidota bacterium]